MKQIETLSLKKTKGGHRVYLNNKTLEKIGFNKLLSKGKISNKYRIKVPYASKKAIEKIKKGGGEVILPKQDKE